MSAQATPPFALRPMLPADVPQLAEILRESVLELTGDDYNEQQQEAWISVLDDLEAFAARLAGGLTIVVTLGGAVVGFASLEGNDTIDLLYVHPAAAGQGAGAMLADALEKLAGSRGVAALKVDASDTAYGFFIKRGYVAQQRNSVERGGEWLANTTMQKPLGGDKA
ncbi:MAG: GNAT family N-acetyltransferase [Xanthobacteraceae bacterium]|uniref:GNAT family N-acetyltransferase n=1 Tax=Pseudolabrys sp. TaxID=1960880 RepID=UPI003D0EA2EC